MGNSITADSSQLLPRASENSAFPIHTLWKRSAVQTQWVMLPEPLWQRIMAMYVDVHTLCRLRCVNIYFNNIIVNSKLWAKLVVRDFPTMMSGIVIKRDSDDSTIDLVKSQFLASKTTIADSRRSPSNETIGKMNSEASILKQSKPLERLLLIMPSTMVTYSEIYRNSKENMKGQVRKISTDTDMRDYEPRLRWVAILWRWSRSPLILAPIPLLYLVLVVFLPLRLDHTIHWKWTTVFTPIIVSNVLLAIGILPYTFCIEPVEDSRLKFDFFKNSMDFILLMGEQISSTVFFFWRLLHQITFWSYFVFILGLCVFLDSDMPVSPQFIFILALVTMGGLFIMFVVMTRITISLANANPLTQVISMMMFMLALTVTAALSFTEYGRDQLNVGTLMAPIFIADGMYMFAPCIAYALRKYAASKFPKVVAPEDLCAHTVICAGVLIPFVITEIMLISKLQGITTVNYLNVFIPLWVGIFLYSWCWLGIIQALRSKDTSDEEIHAKV
jgi:hypothetical protein